MDDLKDDSRRAAVLSEAFKAFVNYGFRRTTMDDIARAVGMSRPALYLLYKNKQDILAACMFSMMEEMQQELAQSFGSDASTAEKLKAGLRIGFLDPHYKIKNTPHGAEIFDLKNEQAADLFRQWMAAVETGLAHGLKQEADVGRIDLSRTPLSPERLASLLIDGFEGAKMRMTAFEELDGKISDLVDVMIGPLVVQ